MSFPHLSLPASSSIPNLAVPILLFASLIIVVTIVATTPASLAGRLLRMGSLLRATIEVVQKRRVERRTILLLSAVGVSVGLSVGAVLSLWIGMQGWLVGLGLVIVGALSPSRLFESGWRRSLIAEVNQDCLALLQMVYVLAGVGRRPIDQAARTFARTWRERSALAQILDECPPTESPVEFLTALDMPGQQLSATALTLQQVRRLEREQRRWLLQQRLDSAITDLQHHLESVAKKRAGMAIVMGVLILLPTLMIAIMTPPILQAIQQISGSNVLP
jgi:hypothetical protein